MAGIVIPLNAAALKAFAQTTAARWVLLIIGAAICLTFAWCQGNSHGEASSAIKLDDSLKKVQAADTKAIDKLRDADSKTIGGLVQAFHGMQDTAQRATQRANELANRLSVVSGNVGTITVIHNGAPVPADSGDTVKKAGIQRQGDPRVYVVPQFVVDVGQALRDALTKSDRALTQATATLAADARLFRDDSAAMQSRDRAIGIRDDEIKHLKANAGRDCTILPFVSCPPRKVVGVVSLALGLVGGAVLERNLTKPKAKP